MSSGTYLIITNAQPRNTGEGQPGKGAGEGMRREGGGGGREGEEKGGELYKNGEGDSQIKEG